MPEQMRSRLLVPIYNDDGTIRNDKVGTFVPKCLKSRTDSIFSGDEWIYECASGGECHGCGCPVFRLGENNTVPDEIIDFLKWHAQTCPGLFPTAPPQDLPI